jgi:malate dehydrogenase
MKKIITITGAAGNIAYSLIFRILSGNIFHQDTKIQLNLLDISSALPVLMGVKLEIEDCAFKQLEDVVITDKPEIAFAESDYILLVGAKPRSKGMQRADLLLDNANIFQRQAEIIDNNAKKLQKL